jgi:hypothetical protein
MHVVIHVPPPPPPPLSTGPPAAAADGSHDLKRLRMEGGGAVRTDDVAVFSSVCTPASVNFVITSRGVGTLTDDDLGTAPVPAPPSTTSVTAPRALAASVQCIPRWLTFRH